MKISGKCSHCGMHVEVVINLPTTWGAAEIALIDAHDAVSPKCGENWIVDGLYGAPLTSTAPNPNLCRHADVGCECFVRCACTWLVKRGEKCSNPHHESESRKAALAEMTFG